LTQPGLQRRENDMALFWVLITIWTLSLWWLLGAVLLYSCHSLPDAGYRQHRAALAWPVMLIKVWVSSHPSPERGNYL